MLAIKPGAMGSKSNPNTKPPEFAGSTTEAMENALNDALSVNEIKTFVVNTNSQDARDRRRMFVAIAVGMVEYLKHNTDALQILDPLKKPTGDTVVIGTDPSTL
jgi:hypothetical protein